MGVSIFVKKQFGDLFDFQSSKCIYHAVNVNIIDQLKPNYYRYVVRSSVNNGIRGYISEPVAGLNPANTISLAQDTGEFFYQDRPYFTGNKVKVLVPKGFELTRYTALYLMTAMKKAFYGFSWGSSFNTKVMKQVEAVVPVAPSGELDTDYMTTYIKKIEADYIRKIEADYIRKIEAYLSVLGYNSLEDCNLSSRDLKVLKGPDQWGKIRLDQILLFSSIPQAKSQMAIPTDNNISTRIPYIVQSVSNNMCGRFVNKKWLITNHEPIVKGNCIALGVTLPAVSYQSEDFGGSQLIIARSNYLDRRIGLYIATAISKHLYLFSYGKKPGLKIYKNLLVTLPVDSAGHPDYAFMEAYITAIEKKKVLLLKQRLDKRLDLYQRSIKK